MPRIGSVEPDDAERGVSADAGIELDEEEEIHEDPEALDMLISRLAARGELGYGAALPPEESPEESAVDEKPVRVSAKDSGVAVPVALDNWNQDDVECLATLDEAGIEYREPAFATEFVKTPVLLEGPVEGVSIRPRWPRPHPENAVMDCRLAVALIEVARRAKEAGVTEILFYSTYRPVRKPSTPCARGKKGKKCRAALARYKKAKKGKMSQHRRALAIDIRWFTTADGETWDVLEDYERNSGSPPCEDEPETEAGEFLKEFACSLHASKTFNVILTPNANKEHHNHFHMDITPDAEWYIIR